MNNLQETREAIIKAVPEIVELKEGCRAIIGDIKHPLVLLHNRDSENVSDWLTKDRSAIISTPPAKIKEIIGRPITLADVLVALESATTRTINLNPYGELLTIAYYDQIDKYHYTHWNLSKDLSKQSPETINFLHSLLIKG